MYTTKYTQKKIEWTVPVPLATIETIITRDLSPNDLEDITVRSWKNMGEGPGDLNMPSLGKMATG